MIKFTNINMKEYPYVLYPQTDVVNKNLIDYENSKTGFTENNFDQKLKKYFGSHILKNVVINDGRAYPYQPDFVLHYKEYDLFVDIEIDEPYAYKSRKPIHVDDDKRDKYFLSKGWSIIRFAEVQIVKYPELCCKVISEHLRNMTGERIWIEGFNEHNDLSIVKAWNIDDAKQMASNSYRQAYLKFLKKIDEEKASINIIADGIFLDNEIQKTKKILKDENSIEKFRDSIKTSSFLKLVTPYIGHFKSYDSLENKTYIEFAIYISGHHSISNFSFDTDFIEIEDYIINVYYIRTNDFISFEIFDKIKKEELKQVMLIADDPAYPQLLHSINSDEIILVRKYRDSHMPSNYRYINIGNLIEEALEIVYK